MRVNVRFNTDYPSKSKFAWRVIHEGKETLVNEVRIEVPCFTTSEFIEGLGMKYHISADANGVIFEEFPDVQSLIPHPYMCFKTMATRSIKTATIR